MSTKDMLEKHRLLALKTRDNSLFNLLERALSAIRCFELSKGGNYKATEEEVRGIISKEVRACKESAALYCKKANSAQDEESRRQFRILHNVKLSEAGLLERYLPQSASEAEMSAAVQDAKLQVEKAGVPKGKQSGIIIKLARKELANHAFDEGRLEKMVEAL